MKWLALIVALTPQMALAWERLDGAGIEAALVDRRVIFDDYTQQTFTSQGRTQYVTERAADGYWQVDGGLYCVSWPPSLTVECYALEVEGDRLRFTSTDGVSSVGTYAAD
jgi:hypothetical protein